MWKYKIYSEIKKAVSNLRVLTTSDAGILAGYHIVITGTLWATRDRIYQIIRNAGGYPQDRVDSRTNLLVIGHQPGNNKIRDASRYGVEYISGSDLRDILVGICQIRNRTRSVSDYRSRNI